MTHHVVLSLGANLGDPLGALTSALEALAQTEGVEVLAREVRLVTDLG